jgi:inhibitor of KinA sporulation pathway (predicted exonuclease)
MKTLDTFQSALYLDLEMNCPDRSTPGVGAPEIIEVGIVELNVVSLEIIREANHLVRPLREISRRCTRITGLTGDDFKGAKPFKEVIAAICAQWPGKPTGIAWGDDGAILERACRQFHVAMPFRRFIDLSQVLRDALLLQNPMGLRGTVNMLGLSFDGCAHMAVADARNAARIHGEMIRRLHIRPANTAPGPEFTKPDSPTWFAQVLERALKTAHAPDLD